MVAKKKATSSSQSSSSHPVALTQAQLSRVPKRKKGSSPDDQRESKLAKRFCEHKDDEQASSSSQSNTPHPAAQTKRQQELVAEIRRFGRKPKCNPGKSPDDKYEYNLYMRCYRNKKWLPEDFLLLQDKADALDNCNLQLLLDVVLLSMC